MTPTVDLRLPPRAALREATRALATVGSARGGAEVTLLARPGRPEPCRPGVPRRGKRAVYQLAARSLWMDGSGAVRRGRWWVEPVDWMVMVLVTVVLLAFSAAMWLLDIKHADTQPDARGAGRVTPERAAVARDTDEPVASQQQAA